MLNALLEKKPKSLDDLRSLRPKIPLDLLKYSQEILSVFSHGGIGSFEIEEKKKNEIALKNESFMSIIRDIQNEFSLNLSNSLPADKLLKKSSAQIQSKIQDHPFDFEEPAVPLKEIAEEKQRSVPPASKPRDSRGWDAYTQPNPHDPPLTEEDDEEDGCSASSSSSENPANG